MAQKQTNEKAQRNTVPPKLYAYHVAERNGKKYWTRIGAAWDHKDGKGYTIEYDLFPTNAGRVVLRPPQSEEAGDAGEAEAAAETTEGEGA